VNFPKTAQQRHFEDMAGVLIKILADLSEKDRSKVYNHAISLYNKATEKKTEV